MKLSKFNLTPGVIEIDDSTLRHTKEDIRLDQIIPGDILSNKPKLKAFLESYYTFMNMDEFLYQETKVFNDIILDGVARFRVPDPTQNNNQFFTDFSGSSSVLTITSPTGDSPAKFTFDGSSSSVVDTTNNKLIIGTTNQGALPVGTEIIYDAGDGTQITGLTNQSKLFIVFSNGGEIQLSATKGGTAIGLSGVGTGVQHSIKGATSSMTIPLNSINVEITNGNDLPGSLADTTVNQIGKTYTVSGLSSFNNYSASLTTIVKRWVGPGPSNVMNSIEEAMDIDLNDENFLTMMQKEIGISLPRNTVGNKRTLYKQIIDFYKLRGSADSIEIFFRLLFNDNVEVERPYDRTLIPSEGDWDQDPRHTTTLTSASNGSTTVNIAASNNIIKVGSKLISGTTFTLANAPSVTAVSANGKVITLGTAITLPSGASVTFVQRGTYLNQKGFVSYNQVLQDSKKFQKFAYLIKTGRNLTDWENAFDKLVHPAGFIYFAEILIFLQLIDSTITKNHISMPGVQPGVIGIEDIPLLVEAFASQFTPIAVAKIHKSGTLSLLLKNGVISGFTLTSLTGGRSGTGYTSAPTITTSDAASASGFTEANLSATISGGGVTNITITDGGQDYGDPQGTFSAPSAMTFNPATAVNTSSNTITLTTAQAAALNDGDQITYNSGGGGVIANLTSPKAYKVINKSGNTIQLRETTGGGAINLGSQGSGTAHTLTGVTATATFTKSDGQVKSITIGEKGFGYTASGNELDVSFNGTAASGQTTTNPVAKIGLTSDGELDVDDIRILNVGGGFAQLFATVPVNPNATKISKIRVLGPSQKNFRTPPGITFPPPNAVDADGNPLSTNVTAVASFGNLDSNGFITSGDITPSNPGLGYTTDPIVRIASGAHNELRANNQKEILILSLNHNMTNIHNGFNFDNFKTIINNGYKQRKGDFYDTHRLFSSNQQISFLGDVEIQNVDPTNINNNNIRTFVEIE